MLRVKIFSIGKTKEKWLEDAIELYLTRLKPLLTIEQIYLKNEQELIRFCNKESSYICLDLSGRMQSSEEFSEFLFQTFEKEGSRLTFIIGGATGIPKEILEKTPYKVSFSKLTFTHQMVRIILIEQIYRAFEIRKGSDYHK